MARETQGCSEVGCSRPAAFRTRTKPAWCDYHITAILRIGGLEPLEPFTGPNAWRLTRCLKCGCEAHYRFEYTLDQNGIGVATCRACFWRAWAAEQRRLLDGYVDLPPVPVAEARVHAETHGFEYLGPLTSPSLPHDPHRTKCRYCGRISAERLADIGWGCTCQTNPRRAAQTANVSGTGKPGAKAAKNLLKDSKLPVLEWWDHDVNDTSLWETVTVKARREAFWRCPGCGLKFSARVLDMAGHPSCPDCSAKRHVEWQAQLAAWEVIPVADVAELAAAWADDADPRLVTVAGSMTLRRLRCPEGHHPRITPLSFLQQGTRLCRVDAENVARSPSAATELVEIEGIVRAFFAAFTSGPESSTRLDDLRSLFLPGALVVRTCGTEPVLYSVEEFIAPREALLSGGTLVDFREWHVSGRTDLFGDVAHWFGTYAKAWEQDGTPFSGRGMTSLQFVRTGEGWRISAATWDDEREGVTIRSG